MSGLKREVTINMLLGGGGRVTRRGGEGLQGVHNGRRWNDAPLWQGPSHDGYVAHIALALLLSTSRPRHTGVRGAWVAYLSNNNDCL